MVGVQAMAGTLKNGLTWAAGARDSGEDTVLSARAKRANQNMIEAMVMFTPLIIAAAAVDGFNSQTALGATLFFYGRLAYAPLYWMGIPWLRTIAWFVSVIGILMVLLQVLPF